jgi:hypothetical protein
MNETKRRNCGECLMVHVDIVPLRLNGTCPCCEVDHKCTLNTQRASANQEKKS